MRDAHSSLVLMFTASGDAWLNQFFDQTVHKFGAKRLNFFLYLQSQFWGCSQVLVMRDESQIGSVHEVLWCVMWTIGRNGTVRRALHIYRSLARRDYYIRAFVAKGCTPILPYLSFPYNDKELHHIAMLVVSSTPAYVSRGRMDGRCDQHRTATRITILVLVRSHCPEPIMASSHIIWTLAMNWDCPWRC